MSASSDAYTVDRFRWLDQVSVDRDLTPFAFLVAYRIARRANRTTGLAFPTQQTLANEIKATPRGVKKAVDLLQERGHLEVTPGDRWRASNRYRLLSHDLNDGSAQTPDDLNDSSSHTAEPRFTPEEGMTGTAVPDDLNGGSEWAEPPFAQNTITEHHKEHHQEDRDSAPPAADLFEGETRKKPSKPRRSKPEPDALEAEFEAFWRQYPRRTGEAPARAAYRKARRKVDAATILAAAMTYAGGVQVQGREEQWIKEAKNWLSEERWKDPPPTPGRNGATPHNGAPVLDGVTGEPIAAARPSVPRHGGPSSNLEVIMRGLRR